MTSGQMVSLRWMGRRRDVAIERWKNNCELVSAVGQDEINVQLDKRWEVKK